MKFSANLAMLCVAVAILSVGQASAQLAPTQATLRFFEEGPGSVTIQPRRLYASHFDAARARYIGVELTLVDAEPGVVANCQYIKPDGSAMGSIDLGFQLQPSIDASSRGWAEPGNWTPGTYRVVCSGGGRTLAEGTFQMMSNPSDVAGIDVRVARIRLFPEGAGAQVTPFADRKYTTVFPAAQTARVGVELNFAHAPLGRGLEIPWACYYFVPNGQTMGPIGALYAPQPDWPGGYSANAWGWDQPGQWTRGQYTAVCMIHGHPVAVERFEVN